MQTNNRLDSFKELALANDCVLDEERFLHLDRKRPIKTTVIMCLVFMGSVLGTASFIGFLGLALERGVFDALWVFGVLFLGLSLFLLQKAKSASTEALATSFYFNGFASLLIAFAERRIDVSDRFSYEIILFVSVLCIVSIALFKSRLIVWLASVSFLCALHAFLVIKGSFQGITVFFLILLVALLLFNYYEIKIRAISIRISELVVPIRSALFYYVIALSIIRSTLLWSEYFNVTSKFYSYLLTIGLMLAMIFTVYMILKRMQVQSTWIKIAFCLLGIAVVWFSYPACSVGLILAMWAFRDKKYSELVIGSLVFIWAISLYYYDLSITLLNKSLILMATGVVFLGLFLLVKKGGKYDEIK